MEALTPYRESEYSKVTPSRTWPWAFFVFECVFAGSRKGLRRRARPIPFLTSPTIALHSRCLCWVSHRVLTVMQVGPLFELFRCRVY